ncbi:amino acid ABC transporter permease [Enterovirga sp. CN4-39]|uniref:amino acid ABC transporter permease n=1 Tax=Enterovirga sp. CN4-39 TaxID=3400910 RepID=UPI003BFBB775
MSEALRQALDLGLFWEYRQILLGGLLFNAGVFACAAAAALTIGLAASLLRTSRHGPLRAAGTLYVEIFRNAPDYVMLIWVHLVMPILIGTLIGRRVEFDPFLSAVIALGLVYSGYLAETFRAGFQTIPIGNIEAGRSVGMSEFQILRRILLPQVVRRMLPEAMNNFVSLFKATTIVSLIAVPDMMYRVTMVTQQEMQPLPLYTGAALTYFTVIFVVSTLARFGAERWRRTIMA